MTLLSDGRSNTTGVNALRTVRDMLTGDGTYGTTMLVLVLDRYGTAALDWHPETLRMELRDDFHVEPTRANMDRLMAAIAVVTTDAFFKDPARFIQLCNVLSGDEFDPTVFDVADVGECAWGITEALLLQPPDDEDPEPFSDEVRHYVGAVLREEGFVKPPDVLGIALDANWSDHVQFEFADDPEMQAAIYKTAADRTDEIETLLRDGLRALFEQLRALPLLNGTADSLYSRVSAAQGDGSERT